jgi:hypothetical protein
MGLIVKPFTFSAGQVIVAAEHNDNFDTIYVAFNGGIDNDNIATAAGIVDTKLATITTAGKVNFSALTASGEAQGSVAYYNGTTWVVLAPGTSGQQLQTQGAGANVIWADSGTSLPTDLNITGQANGTILYFDGSNWVVLAVGTAGQLLQSNASAAPTWVDAPTPAGMWTHVETLSPANVLSIQSSTLPTDAVLFNIILELECNSLDVSSIRDIQIKFNAGTPVTILTPATTNRSNRLLGSIMFNRTINGTFGGKIVMNCNLFAEEGGTPTFIADGHLDSGVSATATTFTIQTVTNHVLNGDIKLYKLTV